MVLHKINTFLNIYMYKPYMYLMINVIHTEVLEFIEQIFSINSVLFECIHNFIFIIKIFLKNQYLFLYITIYYKFVYCYYIL